jgi:hypothetical protein
MDRHRHAIPSALNASLPFPVIHLLALSRLRYDRYSFLWTPSGHSITKHACASAARPVIVAQGDRSKSDCVRTSSFRLSIGAILSIASLLSAPIMNGVK